MTTTSKPVAGALSQRQNTSRIWEDVPDKAEQVCSRVSRRRIRKDLCAYANLLVMPCSSQHPIR